MLTESVRCVPTRALRSRGDASPPAPEGLAGYLDLLDRLIRDAEKEAGAYQGARRTEARGAAAAYRLALEQARFHLTE